MKKVTIPNSKSTKLFMAIEANMSSFRKRGISYIINAHSDDLASVSLSVSGRRGTARKDIMLKYDSLHGWQTYVDNTKYTLLSLSEFSSVCKSIVARLATTMTKL